MVGANKVTIDTTGVAIEGVKVEVNGIASTIIKGAIVKIN
jgi:hypothetical protein